MSETMATSDLATDGAWCVVETSDEPAEVFEIRQDYLILESIMKKWEIRNTHQPFTKNVACILGTTSSGKSSFVNHFYGLGIKKTATWQLDTHFTMVEVIPEKEFAALVGHGYARKSFSEEELQCSTMDPYADSRRNTVYAILDTAATIVRHEQFESFAKTFRQHELIQSILINEHYLPSASEEDQQQKTQTIIIDSPGFTAETDLSKLKMNLEVLRYFYGLSDLTLFFIPADSINLIASQLAMLEMSVLYAVDGAARFQEIFDKATVTNATSQSFSMLDVFSLFARKLTGGMKKSKVVQSYDGTLYWDRVRFVLTKTDRGHASRNQAAQFFELGCLLGRQLQYLKPPVFDQCFGISIAQHSSERIDSDVNDIDRVVREIGSLNFYDSYKIRLEHAVHAMCDELKEKITSSWWHTTYLSKTDTDMIEKIYLQSKRRCKDRSTLQ